MDTWQCVCFKSLHFQDLSGKKRHECSAYNFVCFVLSNCVANLGMHSQRASLCKIGCCRTLTQKGTLLCWRHKARCRVLQCIWQYWAVVNSVKKQEKDRPTRASGSTRFLPGI